MLAVVSVGKEGAHHLTQLFLLCACVCVCVPTNLPIEVLQELLTVGVADSGDALTLGRGGEAHLLSFIPEAVSHAALHEQLTLARVT